MRKKKRRRTQLYLEAEKKGNKWRGVGVCASSIFLRGKGLPTFVRKKKEKDQKKMKTVPHNSTRGKEKKKGEGHQSIFFCCKKRKKAKVMRGEGRDVFIFPGGEGGG